MQAIAEIVLALLAVVGLLSLGWLLFGKILTPVGGGRVWAVVPGEGDGGDLEQAVAGLLWLRGGGLMQGTVVIADCGLNAVGRATAAALALREPGIVLCPASDLAEHLRRPGEGGH